MINIFILSKFLILKIDLYLNDYKLINLFGYTFSSSKLNLINIKNHFKLLVKLFKSKCYRLPKSPNNAMSWT